MSEKSPGKIGLKKHLFVVKIFKTKALNSINIFIQNDFKLLTAWIMTFNAFKAYLNPAEKEKFLKELEENIPQLPRDLTATERVNIKLALENLLKGETPSEASRLKQIKF